MTNRFPLPTAEQVALIRAEAERELNLNEYHARATVPISEHEREETLRLIEWFTRRYPTPADRLRYARRAWKRWCRAMPYNTSHKP